MGWKVHQSRYQPSPAVSDRGQHRPIDHLAGERGHYRNRRFLGARRRELSDLHCRISAGSPCIDAADNVAVPADTLDLDGDGDAVEPIPLDLRLRPRFVNNLNTLDSGNPSPQIPDRTVDMRT